VGSAVVVATSRRGDSQVPDLLVISGLQNAAIGSDGGRIQEATSSLCQIYVINGIQYAHTITYIYYTDHMIQLDTTMYSCSVLECTIPSSVLLSSGPSTEGLLEGQLLQKAVVRLHELSPWLMSETFQQFEL